MVLLLCTRLPLSEINSWKTCAVETHYSNSQEALRTSSHLGRHVYEGVLSFSLVFFAFVTILKKIHYIFAVSASVILLEDLAMTETLPKCSKLSSKLQQRRKIQS